MPLSIPQPTFQGNAYHGQNRTEHNMYLSQAYTALYHNNTVTKMPG